MRRLLDGLYAASGALAALCLASIALVMLAQAAMREMGYLLRGGDDIVSWLCAASAYLALAYTFRHGELVRVGLVIERLPPRARRRAELLALALAVLFAGYMTYAVVRFVHESWQFEEVAQGLIQIPIWMPQMSLVVGSVIFFIAVLDEFIVLARGGRPAYLAADDARRAGREVSEAP